MRSIEKKREFGKAMSEVRDAMGKYNPGYGKRQKIGESVRFLSRFVESNIPSNREVESAKTWITRGGNVLQKSVIITDTLCLRNYLDDMRDDQYSTFSMCMSVSVSVDAISLSGSNLGDSMTRETKKSIERFLNEADRDLKYPDSDFHIQTWFILFNIIEALDSLTWDNLLTDAQDIAQNHEGELRSSMGSSESLRIYAHDLSKSGRLPIDIKDTIDRGNIDARGSIFDVLGRLRRGEEVDLSDLPSQIPNKKSHLWGISRAWILSMNGTESGIVPFYLKVPTGETFRSLFPQTVDEDTRVEETDLKKVSNMDDESIQEHLTRIFNSNSRIEVAERITLDRELQKSHGPAEISDFDVKISIDGEKDIWVSFPIKSSSETSGKDAEKLVQSNLHQLLRPFNRFNRCVVFPILITELDRSTTLNLQEAVKSLKSEQDYPIKIIDKKAFAHILKSHNQI